MGVVGNWGVVGFEMVTKSDLPHSCVLMCMDYQCVCMVLSTPCGLFNLFFFRKFFLNFLMGPTNAFKTSFLKRGDPLCPLKSVIKQKPLSSKGRVFIDFGKFVGLM